MKKSASVISTSADFNLKRMKKQRERLPIIFDFFFFPYRKRTFEYFYLIIYEYVNLSKNSFVFRNRA